METRREGNGEEAGPLHTIYKEASDRKERGEHPLSPVSVLSPPFCPLSPGFVLSLPFLSSPPILSSLSRFCPLPSFYPLSPSYVLSLPFFACQLICTSCPIPTVNLIIAWSTILFMSLWKWIQWNMIICRILSECYQDLFYSLCIFYFVFLTSRLSVIELSGTLRATIEICKNKLRYVKKSCIAQLLNEFEFHLCLPLGSQSQHLWFEDQSAFKQMVVYHKNAPPTALWWEFH